MIYKNKIYSIPDVSKRLKIREQDINKLIVLGIIPTSKMFGVKFLKGDIVLSLYAEIKKFNEELKKGKLSKGKFADKNKRGTIEISKGELIND